MMMNKSSLLFATALVIALPACDFGTGELPPDAGLAAPDAGEALPDAGQPPVDAGEDPPDAGEAPDAGPPDAGPPPPDAGPDDGGVPDAGPPDAGPPPPDAGPPVGNDGGPAPLIDCTGAPTQLLHAGFGDQVAAANDTLGSTDVPGGDWTQLGDQFATRDDGTADLIIEATSIQGYAGAYAEHSNLGNVATSRYRLRTLLRPGSTVEGNGNVVRFLIQAGTEAPQATSGVGMEFDPRGVGILRIIDQAHPTNRNRGSDTIGSGIVVNTTVYALEMCITANGASLTVSQGDFGPPYLSIAESNDNLIPTALANPIYRIEGYTEGTGANNIKIDMVELARIQ